MLVRKIRKRIYRFTDSYLTHALLKNIKSVDIKSSKYLFVFNQVDSKFTEKLYILISHRLAAQGIASSFLYNKHLLSPYYPRLDIDGYQISNSLIPARRGCIKSSHELPLFFEWTVDIEHNRIEAEGINFFSFIRNTLRSMQKRYNVFYNNQDIKDLILSCDLILKYFSLFKDYSKKNQKKIRFVGFEVDYIPNGILRMLCEQSSHNNDIDFIELRRGYISYFGQHHHRASYVSMSNLSKTKMESGLAVSKQELAGFDKNSFDLDELLKPVSNALAKDMGYTPSDGQLKTIKTIEDYRSQGKKIFVLFAHVFYDTPLDDDSKVFIDMCEWIMETITYFRGKEDLLLIKPHPAEFVKDQPKKTPTETIASFLSDTELSENIIILERDLFTIKDLSPFVSCGLIWRSSVAMELTFLGIPCIIAGNPLYRALDLNYAKDKKHYFHVIDQADQLKITEKQKIEVAKYIYLLENKHIHINCIKYERNLRKFCWVRKALRKYLKDGNKEVESVVANMLA